MCDRDRRQDMANARSALRAALNEEQALTLSELERFGWELRFVRKPLFQDAIPVVADGDRKSFSVLNPDGSLDDHPALKLRAPIA
ncbi:hypothetical protein [Lysobacter solisilvae (ex Woo and Kim 2020)]|uniref:Uncharacterized protein n=1 Tax=Agrilutibacter terrestris TaxID=2865112 RepID=A0A7H0FX42_9GAMM|nr:hypothetical protein [Lysobacter terrestris]QNP40608.1 hypothetical protein H8B22_14265 [Lysobacter terrestris]